MNLIDRVLLEWSYKTSKGYPDINSQEDMYPDDVADFGGWVL